MPSGAANSPSSVEAWQCCWMLGRQPCAHHPTHWASSANECQREGVRGGGKRGKASATNVGWPSIPGARVPRTSDVQTLMTVRFPKKGTVSLPPCCCCPLVSGARHAVSSATSSAAAYKLMLLKKEKKTERNGRGCKTPPATRTQKGPI